MAYKGFGLGCGSLSAASEAVAKESSDILHAALDQGVTFLNTADFYGVGESEMAIGQTLKGRSRDHYFLSLKFGSLMAPNGMMYGLDVHPARVKNYLAHSLKRLKTDYVDLYQPGRIDLAIGVEETIGPIADLVKEGYVKHIGLTQVDAKTLRRANAIHPISYVEMEYSLFNRSIEESLLPTARELGIPVVVFGVLAHGLLGGTWTSVRVQQGEAHPKAAYIELFQSGNMEKNTRLAENLLQIAQEKGVSLPALMYAWARTKGEDIIPLIGVRTKAQLIDCIQAQEIRLTSEEIAQIEAAVPAEEIAGSSFPNRQFRNGVAL